LADVSEALTASIVIALMMVAVRTPETSVDFQRGCTARHPKRHTSSMFIVHDNIPDSFDAETSSFGVSLLNLALCISRVFGSHRQHLLVGRTSFFTQALCLQRSAMKAIALDQISCSVFKTSVKLGKSTWGLWCWNLEAAVVPALDVCIELCARRSVSNLIVNCFSPS
jgi:hypothetical protein